MESNILLNNIKLIIMENNYLEINKKNYIDNILLNNIKLIIMENNYLEINKKNYINNILLKNNFYVDYVESGG
jgi:hypothetical protein